MSDFMRSLCGIALPVTLQSMLQSSFSMIDQVMIGQLGETGIAAVGLCGNFSLIFSVMLGAVSTVAGIPGRGPRAPPRGPALCCVGALIRASLSLMVTAAPTAGTV